MRLFQAARQPTGIRRYSILFFGSDEFATVSLEKLVQAKEAGKLNGNAFKLGSSSVQHLEVVCPPRKTPRHTIPVMEWAIKHKLPLHIAPPTSLRGWQPNVTRTFDLAVVVSFGYFLPASLLETFRQGALNVHPSLLPKYRGPAPIHHALLNEDKETGVSIIELHHHTFDAGRILKQSILPLSPEPHFKPVHDSLAIQGAQDVLDTIEHLSVYQNKALVQDETLVTRAPKITKEASAIDFKEQSAHHIYKLHRVLGYKVKKGKWNLFEYPIYAMFRGKMVQLLQVSHVMDVSRLPKSAEPGFMYFDMKKNALLIKCQSGWIECTLLKVQDKKPVTAKDFKNGYQLITSNIFI